MQTLGLISVTPLKSASILAKGDVIEYSYHDKFEDIDYSFKINENESDENKMIYYGTYHSNISGGSGILRRTVSATENSLLVKEEVKANGEFVSRGTREYVANADKIVDEFYIRSDGIKKKDFVWRPNSPTSLVKKSVYDGAEYVIDDILVVQKD